MTGYDASTLGNEEKHTETALATQEQPSLRTASKDDDYGDKIEEVEETSQDCEYREDSDPDALQGNDAEAATAAPVEKKTTRISVNNLASIPNGGFRAWMQVMGSFFIFYNSWGIINTYGVYQTYYQLDILKRESPSAISWIGSIQAFLLMMVGAVTGPVYDAGYFRELLWSGSFFIVFGHMMLSLCKEYYQVLLAQAFCIGGGAGLIFVPGVAIISTYFTTKLAIATGIAAAGSSLGGVLYPVMLNKLIPQVGFPWAVRIIGFLCLATLSVPLLAMKVRVLPAAKRPLVDWSALRQPEYVLFVTGSFVGFLGLYSLFFYVQSYAIAKGLMDRNLAFYLLSMLNAASAFGRTVPNLVADKIGPLNCLTPAAIMSGVVIALLIPANSSAALIVLVLLFGFFSGTYVSLPPTVVVYMTKNRGLIGTRLGMCFAVVSIGMLIGPPIQGAILRKSGFNAVWIFGGVVTIAGGLLLLASRIAFKGWKLMVKG
ncbi:uncharacterized protein PV09_01258 [Verruconis gallopava]|uniref:Major facilitator superfamily (MFS) profile domain-containing protein n=1 Tax=Verruconis gallopava TaxID=253628 RepID=A0A0D2AP64_9PEZI|nr:uncharacterized protein PV09_01258 [Verruconis gallopava]KIW08340.1 hypothetical protein PV09_01258 [Verruconis gallopava]